MTKEERLVVSAYTGILMTNFSDLRKYAEEKLGKPVFTHMFANDDFLKKLADVVRPDFLKLCVDEE